jgi:hypothetical protein
VMQGQRSFIGCGSDEPPGAFSIGETGAIGVLGSPRGGGFISGFSPTPSSRKLRPRHHRGLFRHRTLSQGRPASMIEFILIVVVLLLLIGIFVRREVFKW